MRYMYSMNLCIREREVERGREIECKRKRDSMSICTRQITRGGGERERDRERAKQRECVIDAQKREYEHVYETKKERGRDRESKRKRVCNRETVLTCLLERDGGWGGREKEIEKERQQKRSSKRNSL
jgi:hypothetical protein